MPSPEAKCDNPGHDERAVFDFDTADPPILEVRLTAELAYLFANSAPQFSEKN